MVINDDRPQHGERRVLLLNVAKRIFAERGFQATTMDDIAKEAGFTKPILYQYFESKTDLYKEIVADIAQKLIWKLAHAVSKAESPRAKIEVAFNVYFELVNATLSREVYQLDQQPTGELSERSLRIVLPSLGVRGEL